jgi:hypothetical protein
LARVDTDANEGFCIISATNLEQAVVEYGDMKFPPVNPALHVHMFDVMQPIHDAPELVGHATHVPASVAPAVVEYVPSAHAVHDTLPVVFL